MSKKFLRLTMILVIILTGPVLIANDKNWGSYDRLLVIQRFLSTLYPDLKDIRGMLTLRTEEFHTAIEDVGALSQVDVISCHPGSGVPGGYRPGEPPPLPHCTGLYPSGPSEFLSISVMFSSPYPIRSFSANGSFLGSKGKPVQQDIIDHPEWNEDQRGDALRRANPRFGPDQKEELLRVVPVKAILSFTGCRLQLDTAVLYTFRYESAPDPPSAGFAWRISGTRLTSEHEDRCMARFDPFEGKIVGID